ncbi:MAG: MliC family protein [Candidatus Pacebacteria bacterium]|nr:MliC family protein [Candidatus Paceibacterota bacterium]
MKKIVLVVLVLAVAAGAYWYGVGTSRSVVADVAYVCTEGKTIHATYYEGKKIEVAPGEQPVPTGSVDVVLSDGRSMTLPQTLSASGIRYANQDESLIFWSKGSGAFVVEGDAETYSGCTEQQ